MNTVKTIVSFAAVWVALAATGCATGPDAVERDFGNSVRNMQQAQTMNPSNAAVPDPNATEHSDGYRLKNVVDAYREDVSKPEEVGQPIVLTVGGN